MEYPHEYKALMVTLRNIIINIMDRFGLFYNEDSQTFYKHGTGNNYHKLVSIQDIMKGLG